MVDTGKNTKTGGRLLRLKNFFNHNEDFMLTYGDGLTNLNIKNLVFLISSLIQREIKVKKTSERVRPHKSEVSRLCASNKKAKKLLKWQPGFVGKQGLRRGLIKTIDWYKKNSILKEVDNKLYVI